VYCFATASFTIPGSFSQRITVQGFITQRILIEAMVDQVLIEAAC
jgi:hypothetical protein